MANRVDLVGVLDDLKTLFEAANTTTATYYLSQNLSDKINYIGTAHPLKIQVQDSRYPFVTAYVTGKKIKNKTIAKDQLNGQREAQISIDIVGAIMNNRNTDIDKDKAQYDCLYLMENIEIILRANSNINGKVLWQVSEDVNYYDSVSNSGYIRAGILGLKASVYY